jgi:hypothetical protein
MDTRRVSIDLPPPVSPVSPDPEASGDTMTPLPRRSRTGRLIATDVRTMIAKMYRNEIMSMIKWRDFWKKFGDSCEAIAKCMTGLGAILAFASSAIRDPKTADILSFSSGTVGTIGLVVLAYSSYAIKESKQRTDEMNGILSTIGVTPLPDIAEEDDDIPGQSSSRRH